MNESKKNLTVDPNLLQAKPQVAGGPNATVASDACFVAIKDPYRPKRLRASVCLWLFILILAFGVQSTSAQTVWSEGAWYPDSDGGVPAISEIPWSYLTHVDFVGGAPQSGGSIALSNSFTANAAALITAAHANGVKVNYELGNAAGIGTDFNDAMSGSCSSGALQTFITNIMSTVNSYGFDGVFVDYEESYSSQFPIFMSCLRKAMGTKLIEWYAGTNYQIGQLGAGNAPICTGAVWPDGVALTVSGYVDRVIMSGYDLNNPIDSSGVAYFNSPLYNPSGQALWSVDSAAKIATNCGISASKVSISIPFYGDLYSINSAPYQTQNPSSAVTPMYYSTLVATYNLSGATFDSTAKVPWMAVSATGGNPAGYISYENAQSVTDKINYVYANGLGGWMIWTMGNDYTSGSMPLLTAVGKAFAPQPQPPTGLQIMLVN
jgi:chitinase